MKQGVVRGGIGMAGVAPCAGARIETIPDGIAEKWGIGRPLRGGAD